jgi:hypothetical protein
MRRICTGKACDREGEWRARGGRVAGGGRSRQADVEMFVYALSWPVYLNIKQFHQAPGSLANDNSPQPLLSSLGVNARPV